MGNVNDADQTMLDVLEELRDSRRYANRQGKKAVRYRESQVARSKAPVDPAYEALKRNGLL